MKEEQSESKKVLSIGELAQVAGGNSYGRIHINESICTGCGDCDNTCPAGAIDMSSGKAQVTNYCIECDACADVCPTGAITVS